MEEARGDTDRVFLWRWAIPDAFLRSTGVLTLAGVLFVLLAGLEWYFHLDFSLGIAYTLPVALASLVLTRWRIFMFAIFCAYVRGQFTPQETVLEQVLRFAMAVTAYTSVGMLIAEMSRNRKAALADMARLQLEQRLRKRAEEQLRLLAESSPAGILTIDGRGTVLAANRALGELLGLKAHSLIGRMVEPYLPVFMQALRLPSGPRQVRTTTSSWARREDGVVFPVMCWFSTYMSGDDRYLAAIVVDVSEEVRDRERENYRHQADAQRLLAGAVSHEIRNLCSAVSVVIANIERRGAYEPDADWTALTNLTAGLARIASFELKSRSDTPPPPLNLPALLDQLRVVIEQDWLDDDAVLAIHESPSLPLVQADAHGLLQVFLNLAQNSLRAVGSRAERLLTISAYEDSGGSVIVSFVDSGHGVGHVETLFQPFRPGADGTGLGLYVSRTLMRSFGGDLLFVPIAEGCRFDVVLATRGEAHGDAALPH